MGAITYSNDQLQIIESRNENLLVSAAAGSGKTAVLVERIIRKVLGQKNDAGEYIEKGIDIDKLLVVTFTNAAAREMKARIMKALEEKLAMDPNDSHLAKQATLIHNAKIMTIDSFCLYLVKNHFNEIGIDPSFRIAPEGEIKLLKQDIITDIIKRAYEENDEDFIRLVDSYSNKENDGKLSDCILQLFSFAMSYPWPHKWIEEHRKDYSFANEEDFLHSELAKGICMATLQSIEKAKSKLDQAKAICMAGPSEYLKSIDADEDLICKCLEALKNEDLLGFKTSYESKNDVRLATKASGTDEEKAAVKALRDSWKKLLKDTYNNFFVVSIKTAVEDMNQTGRIVNKMMDLLEQFMEEFNEAKRERAIIDFIDMEHMAVQILIEDYNGPSDYKITGVAQSYRDYFEEVMVDEYQDANLVQEILLRSVSREDLSTANNRFMVGDVKQSIYRFRLARPQIFMDKQKLYGQKEDSRNRLITLKENYRSRKSVIDSINAVFENIMTQDFGGTGYDDEQRLYAKAEYPFEDSKENKTELLVFEKEDNYATNEMLAVVLKIKQLRGKMMISDKDAPGGMRLADYRDFAILFRSSGPQIDTLCDFLEEMQIPFHLTGSGAFYSAREVKEVLNFLRVLNNPLDDISLYGMMVSFFGGFTDEEMAKICSDKELTGYYLWDKVNEYLSKTNDEKIKAFIERVNEYRKRSVYTAIAPLISQILDETGYTLYVAALADGGQRLANVKMLITKAAEFSKTSFHGLFHFLRYLELMEKISVDEGEADISDENANTVRLMSIHKSKGLEFPICFVVSLGKQFNNRDMANAFVTDIDRGIGAQFIDPKLRIKRDTLRRKYVVDKMAQESLSEEIRVLYVAMTRAREKLIMTASVKKADEYLEKAEEGKTSCFLDLMLPYAINKPNLFDVGTVDLNSQEFVLTKDSLDLKERRLSFENREISESEEEISKELKARFDFEYPYKNLEKLYTKTTVSELKIAALEENEGESHNPFPDPVRTAKVPVFAGGSQAVSGTDRGTAFHKILSILNFEEDLESANDIEAAEDRLIAMEKLTKEEKEIVSLEKLALFMKTPIAQRMKAAAKRKELYKEQPFVIGLKADKVDKDFPSDETILVQGVIDVFFEEDGKIVVLDYKTDRVDTGEELVTRYKTQLDYYGQALTMITGLQIKEKVIYSFGLNQTIVIK